MGMKHTPGPWRVEEGTTLVWGACIQDDLTSYGLGYPVARMEMPSAWSRAGRPDMAEQAANALLIAEAPAMADALDALVMEMRSIGQHLVYNAPTQGITAAMDNATAILDRIRGDAP